MTRVNLAYPMTDHHVHGKHVYIPPCTRCYPDLNPLPWWLRWLKFRVALMVTLAAFMLSVGAASAQTAHGPGRPDLWRSTTQVQSVANQTCDFGELMAASRAWAALTAPAAPAAQVQPIARWPTATGNSDYLRQQADALKRQADALDTKAKAEARWRVAVAACSP